MSRRVQPEVNNPPNIPPNNPPRNCCSFLNRGRRIFEIAPEQINFVFDDNTTFRLNDNNAPANNPADAANIPDVIPANETRQETLIRLIGEVGREISDIEGKLISPNLTNRTTLQLNYRLYYLTNLMGQYTDEFERLTGNSDED